jgi:hypothetical protein
MRKPAFKRETREAWMMAATEIFRPKFFEMGFPLPDVVRTSMGFPSKMRGGKVVGQCHYTADDLNPQVFVSPTHGDEVSILSTLLHELIHSALGPGVGHAGDFVRVAKLWGFTAPWTSTPMGSELKATLTEIATTLGPIPHSKITLVQKVKRIQGTRLRLWQCSCGVKVRVARDKFNATCTECDTPFTLQDAAKPAREPVVIPIKVAAKEGA